MLKKLSRKKTVEEIKYSLPDDPKEARKDFSIIDNRDGSTTDLLEDGSNKWIVVNDKTNKIVETRTKRDAENLARNPEGNWDYGEGDVIGEREVVQQQEEIVSGMDMELSKSSGTTQVATTVGSYKKSG